MTDQRTYRKELMSEIWEDIGNGDLVPREDILANIHEVYDKLKIRVEAVDLEWDIRKRQYDARITWWNVYPEG